MKEREAMEVLMAKVEAYLIALLREAVLEPLTPTGKRDEATVKARFVLLDTVEQLQQETPDIFR